MKKVAILVLNYSMPEMTDALVASIKKAIRHPHDLFVIDNGSPPEKVAQSTTHRMEQNKRITGGFNYGLQQIRASEHRHGVIMTPHGMQPAMPYDAVWFVCNDIRLTQPSVDVVAACMARIHQSRALTPARPIGIIHPGMTIEKGVWNHPHMNRRANPAGVRDEDWVDIICPIYSREMMETLGWEFDPELVHGWGVDRYTCAEAWMHNLRVTVCDDVEVWHQMGTTYNAGVDPTFKNFEAYKGAAGGNQGEVLSRKYGADYMEKFARARREYYERTPK